MMRQKLLAFLLVLPAILFLPCSAASARAEEAFFKTERERMVRTQLEARGIDHKATLAAMGKVPRHLFVGQRLARNAYGDGPLPIGYGQTISQPYIVALMTELADPGAGQKILEIGTGSGYQAAVLSETGAMVYTVEIIPELAESAETRFKELGYGDIGVLQGDGYFGWKAQAPYDAILVTAAAEFIPPPLLEQLKDGGRMIIPVGSPFRVQKLMLVEKMGETYRTRNLLPVRFVPFRRSP